MLLVCVRLTYVRINNQAFSRVDAAQHGDSTVVRAELCSASGWVSSVVCMPWALLAEWSLGAPQTDILVNHLTHTHTHMHTAV